MSNKIAKPIISIPVRVNQRAIKRQEKIRIKELEEVHSRYSKGDGKFPIIKCRRQELDHFRGQTYAPFKSLPMASEHWMSRSTIGDFFSFVPFRGGENRIFGKKFVTWNILLFSAAATKWFNYEETFDENAIQYPKENEEFVKSMLMHAPKFENFGLDSSLVNQLIQIGIKKPTNIQNDTFDPIMKGTNVLIASETGNGKTLAFVIPSIQKILNTQDSKSIQNRPPNSPLIVIGMISTPILNLYISILLLL